MVLSFRRVKNRFITAVSTTHNKNHERRAAKLEALIRVAVLDFYGCDNGILNDEDKLKEIMLESARLIGATVVDTMFSTYNPAGVSGVVIIAESHLAIHTWPEYGYAAITFETCGKKIDPWKSLGYLQEKLKSERCSQIEMFRGLFDVPAGALPHKPPET